MRVVITGGSGLIGRHLTAALVASGDEVVILSRNPGRVRGLPSGVAVEAWDGESIGPWASVLEGAAIVHLAGENIADGRWSEARKKRIRDSRVLSGRALAEAIDHTKKKPSVLVQGSAVGYYGPRSGAEPIREDDRSGDDFLARLSIEWEASTAGVENHGVRRPVIRTGVVLARDGGALPKILLPFRLFAGGPVGSGEQWFPWIHIADQVAAIRFLLRHENATGPFNLSAPNPLTNRDFARALGKVLGRPAFLPAPAFALRLLLGEMAELLLTGQKAVPARLGQLDFAFKYPTAEAALAALVA